MNVDFWPSMVQSAEPLSAVHATLLHSEKQVVLELNEGARSSCPCPFCYIDFRAPLLCQHLLDEHQFDLNIGVCPVCALNQGRDVMGHLLAEHAITLKWRRFENFISSAMQGQKPPIAGRENEQEEVTDSLLSNFICGSTSADLEGIEKVESPRNASVTADERRTEPEEDNEVDREERAKRAAFVQQLTASSIFSDEDNPL